MSNVMAGAVSYFEKRLRLDVAEALDNPQETPVVVYNRDAFKEALAEASR